MAEITFDDAKAFTLETLKKLVSIYSVTGSEAEVGDYIFDCLNALGADKVERQPVEKNRFNVVAEITGNLPGPTILLTGHMDTVPAGDGWDSDPFTPRVEDGHLYGRGALDMKGGIASILATVRFAVQNRAALPGKILVALVPDEEAYSAGVNKLIENGVDADFGIAAEPEYDAIIGSAGKMLVQMDVQGVAAHGAEPEKGLNAVEEAAKFLAALDTLKPAKHHSIKPQPYVTLRIEGGFKEYAIVVPESCRALINKHTVPAEDKAYVLNELEQLRVSLGLKAGFTFTVLEPYYPAFDLTDTLPWLRPLGAAFEAVTGVPMKTRYGTGVSDNNRLVPLTKIPVVCLGPKGDGLHSKNERVELESLYQMNLIYQRFIFQNVGKP